MMEVKVKDNIEFMFDWLFACAKVNPRGINAKILRGEVDYHVLFKDEGKTELEEEVCETPGEQPCDEEWHDIPGFNGIYKMNEAKEVMSICRGTPRIMKPRKLKGCGNTLFVNLMLEPHKQITKKVDELYELTFG